MALHDGGRALIPFGLIPLAWRVAAIAAAVAAILAAGWWLSHRVDTLEAENDTLRSNVVTATAAAQANAAAVDAVKAQAATDMAAVVADRDALARRLAAVAQMKREIANAPASDDGPLAPVLARTLDRLRLTSAGAGPGGSGGEGDTTGRPVDVHR